MAGLFLVRFKAVTRVAVRTPRQRVDPHVSLIPPLERRFLVGRVLGDVNSPRDGDMHWIEPTTARRDVLAELRDLFEDLPGQRMLPQQHVIAALGYLTDRAWAARAHPERGMRLLRRRRLDDDVVELPILAAVRERLLRGECLGDDVERLLEALVRLFHRQAEAGKFVVAVALADAKIEPPAGEEI